MDAVIVRLSASWSPVKDKETLGAQLTLSDGLCEKQLRAHARDFTAPSFRLLEQGIGSSVALSQMTSLVKQLKDCKKAVLPEAVCNFSSIKYMMNTSFQ